MSHQSAPQPPEVIEPGTLLPVFAKVMIVDGELLLITDRAECWTNALVPTGITPEDRAMFMQNLGVVVGITATVQQRVDKWTCEGSKYEVNNIYLTTPPCNPSATKLTKLSPGRPVLVEGEFVSYQENPATYGHWVIKTDHGEITFRSNLARNGTPVYEDGALEGFVGKPVEAGDILRIVAYATDNHELHAEHSEAYLLAPHAERLEAYNRLRRLIAQQISQLETYVKNGRYRDARLLFAALRRLELTNDENSDVCSIMDDVPKNERSIYRSRGDALRLYAAVGIKVESFNTAEFIAFADEVVQTYAPDANLYQLLEYLHPAAIFNRVAVEEWRQSLVETKVSRSVIEYVDEALD